MGNKKGGAVARSAFDQENEKPSYERVWPPCSACISDARWR